MRWNTYGDFKASALLAEILTKLDNKQQIKKIGRFFTGYFGNIKQLRGFHNNKLKKHLIIATKEDYLRRASESKHISGQKEIENFVRNIIMARCREELRRANKK
jgi:hypothetical protein